MKFNNIFLLTLILMVTFSACKKDLGKSYYTASVTVFNATSDLGNIKTFFSDAVQPFYWNVAPIYYGSYLEYGNPAGATPLTIVSDADTTVPLFEGKLNLSANSSYSLFVAGKVKAVDTLLTKDVIPIITDSSASVRFVNFTEGDISISVNLEGNPPSQPEVGNLGHKQVGVFKNYSAANGVTGYNFEIRDVSTGDVLTTFYWNMTLFKSNTLLIAGSTDPASPTPLTVFSINNF